MNKKILIIFMALVSLLLFSSCVSLKSELSKIDENARNRLVGRMIYNNENLVLDRSTLQANQNELLFIVRNGFSEKTKFDIRLMCDSAIKASVPKQTKMLEPGESDILKVSIEKRAYGTCRLMLQHDGEKYVERMFSLK